MQSQPVSFFSQGVRLSGTLARPEPERDTGKAVVLAHGYANTREEMGGFTRLAETLADAGYSSLRFDCRGCGTSGGVKGYMLPATDWVNDLLAALTFLCTENDIDPNHIGAVGISLGGSNVIHAAALDERVRCVVSLCPIGDGRRCLEWLWTQNAGRAAWHNFLNCVEQDRIQRALGGRSEFVSIPIQLLAQNAEGLQNWQRIAAEFPEFRSDAPWESAESIMHWRPVDHVHRIAPRPIRFIHGTADGLVPWFEVEDLVEHARATKDVQRIEGADHGLLVGPFQEQTRAFVLEWLDAYL